jgi:hypothetical protein
MPSKPKPRPPKPPPPPPTEPLPAAIEAKLAQLTERVTELERHISRTELILTKRTTELHLSPTDKQ